MGGCHPLFLEAAKRSLVLIFSKTSFPQWPFWNLPRLRSLWLRCGLSSGLFQVPKDRLPAYARGIYFERTRKPLPDSLRRLLIYFFPRFGGILKPARETLKKRIRRIVTPPPAPLASIIIDVEGRSVGLTPIEIDNHSNKRLKAVTSNAQNRNPRERNTEAKASQSPKEDPLEYSVNEKSDKAGFVSFSGKPVILFHFS
jgi:hypothetical protein